MTTPDRFQTRSEVAFTPRDGTKPRSVRKAEATARKIRLHRRTRATNERHRFDLLVGRPCRIEIGVGWDGSIFCDVFDGLGDTATVIATYTSPKTRDWSV